MPGSSFRIVTVVGGALVLTATTISAGIGFFGACAAIALEAAGHGTAGDPMRFGALYGVSVAMWFAAYVVLGVDHHDAKEAYEAARIGSTR